MCLEFTTFALLLAKDEKDVDLEVLIPSALLHGYMQGLKEK